MEDNTFFYGKQLVAWTSNEKLRMIPSLVEEASAHFVREISKYEKMGVDERALYHLSELYEEYGDFLYDLGYKFKAQRLYQMGALELTATDNWYINDTDLGSYWSIGGKFSSRFFYLYTKASKREYFKESPFYDQLEEYYRRFTAMERDLKSYCESLPRY